MTDLWVGGAGGFFYVFDPRVVHADPAKVFLFNVKRDEFREYSRSYVRKKIAGTTGQQLDDILRHYSAWFSENGRHFVESLPPVPDDIEERIIAFRESERAAEQRRKEEIAASLRDEAIRLHKEFLQETKQPYLGVSKKDSPRRHRITHCWRCKLGLDSDIDISCRACEWIICVCGACGCGYSV